MPQFVIDPPPRMTVPVVGTDATFPVRRIHCVGRNYAAHVREMGGDERQPPFFFQKPADAIVLSGSNVPYPPLTQDLHHEIELVLAIGQGGANIAPQDAAHHVFGLATGIDFTRRDLQAKAKKAGKPWEIGKAFDGSAALTPIQPLAGKPLPETGSIRLSVNGQERQSGNLAELIWRCAEVVSVLSTHSRLGAGDLIYTGTPAGVGAVVPGDDLVGQIDGLPTLELRIGKRG